MILGRTSLCLLLAALELRDPQARGVLVTVSL